MAHYAILNTNNKVIEVFVGKDENENNIDWEQYYSEHIGNVVKRTSFNSRANVHVGGGIPYRKNYAGKGYTYDSVRDAFIPPQPYPSWVLDENTCQWHPPLPMPENIQNYTWNEEIQNFELIQNA